MIMTGSGRRTPTPPIDTAAKFGYHLDDVCLEERMQTQIAVEVNGVETALQMLLPLLYLHHLTKPMHQTPCLGDG